MTPDAKRADAKPRPKKKTSSKAATKPTRAPAPVASTIAEDERRLARGAAIAIPVGSVLASLVVAAFTSAGPGLLVLAGGIILGTIALFWASLRTLTGDAPLASDLEETTFSAPADPLAARKTMLLRALKDLDNEKAIGKIHAKDHALLGQRYREEIKDIMRAMDVNIAPHVKDAEIVLAKHLARVGLAADAAAADDDAAPPSEDPRDDAAPAAPVRPKCPACATTNDADAKFCKSCGATLAAASKEATPAATKSDDETDDETDDDDSDDEEAPTSAGAASAAPAPPEKTSAAPAPKDDGASAEEDESSEKSRVDHA